MSGKYKLNFKYLNPIRIRKVIKECTPSLDITQPYT